MLKHLGEEYNCWDDLDGAWHVDIKIDDDEYVCVRKTNYGDCTDCTYIMDNNDDDYTQVFNSNGLPVIRQLTPDETELILDAAEKILLKEAK